ncbi:prolipoprotein diacylglyceryl transferase [Mycoplasma sp. CSL7503-lung]|uniref:prolipoprotein diacylglyceryl transferase n=1 Tax=Mycoplasma sp. CSL7503-lung TaxID=536372 RepID=UPI0021D0933B|nr:prolipoprotein diacylglyceryl transferase [Mycoplasma sp. CSL7503-lung]MCU4706884.1 prolipoprotein diacylglyceryl transferase [Mycoplasma sp. CSL7503-lung]
MTNMASYIPSQPAFEGRPWSPLIQIGTFEIQTYSLTMMLGYLLSILTVIYFWRREKLKMDVVYTLILITIPMGIIGSRFGYIIEQLIYQDEPFKGSAWYKIWEGGLSIQGGLITTIIVDLAYVYTKRDVVDIRKAGSLIIPTILIGQFIGRFGNYANHEVYGKIDWTGASSLIWGKTFADNMYISDTVTNQLGIEAAYRYPLFLYEAIANLIGYLILVWIFNYFWIFKPGVNIGMYLVWYGLIRMGMEPLREESYKLYEYVALGFVIFGAFLVIYYQFFGRVKYIRVKKSETQSITTYQYANPEIYLSYVNVTSFKHIFKKIISKLKNK